MRKVLLLMLLFVLSINAQANTCNVNGLKYALNHSTNEAVCMGFENEPTDFISISVADYITIADSQYKVIEIGDGAFYNCYYLQNIELPSTLRNIGYAAFAKCSNLQTINIPDSVVLIGAAVLKDTNLTSSATYIISSTTNWYLYIHGTGTIADSQTRVLQLSDLYRTDRFYSRNTYHGDGSF